VRKTRVPAPQETREYPHVTFTADKKIMSENKQKTAAMAAVMAYLEEEAHQLETARPARAPFPTRPWGVAGRQDMMQHRSLMQLKAFHRSK
jgi:hypothetical protein